MGHPTCKIKIPRETDFHGCQGSYPKIPTKAPHCSSIHFLWKNVVMLHRCDGSVFILLHSTSLSVCSVHSHNMIWIPTSKVSCFICQFGALEAYPWSHFVSSCNVWNQEGNWQQIATDVCLLTTNPRSFVFWLNGCIFSWAPKQKKSSYELDHIVVAQDRSNLRKCKDCLYKESPIRGGDIYFVY